MPKNNVSDLITDQEIAFAHLILSGTMTDQRAAEAVGLNPNIASYTKSKPCVRAYMLEHRALMQQQIVEQETEGLRRLNPSREQVLARLWEFANMGPEITRGSITGQVKAISMIVAIEGLIPDRRAGSTQQNPAPPPTKPNMYKSAWLRKQEEEEETAGPQEDDGLADPKAETLPLSAADATDAGPVLDPLFDPGEPAFADSVSFPERQSEPYAAFVPDARVPLLYRQEPLWPAPLTFRTRS